MAFPSGTGIAHCVINNTQHTVRLLVGGEASKASNRIVYLRLSTTFQSETPNNQVGLGMM